MQMTIGRKPTGEQQDVRERLLEAAVVAFSEVGYEAASLRTIAEDAGVSFQLIAYHYGSKEELWKAAANLAYQRFSETGRSLGFDLNGNLREQFRNHLRTLFAAAAHAPRWRKINTHEFMAKSDRYKRVILPQVKEIYRLLSAPYCTQLVRLGIVTRFSDREVNLIVLAFMAAMVLLPDEVELSTGKRPDTPANSDLYAELVFSLCVHGEGSKPGGLPGVERVTPAPETNRTPAKRNAASARAWGEEYNGPATSELVRLRQLEVENEHLKRLVGELSLEKRLLQESLKPT